MQYWQRKLQRSVTDTRRSEIVRPWPSTRGSSLTLWKGIRVDAADGNPRADARQPQARGAVRGGERDRRLHAWWYMQQVNADRRDMSDHSWVHIQIVVNIALRLFRLLNRGGVEPAMVTSTG